MTLLAAISRRASSCLWPERAEEPLSAIRADPGRGAVLRRLGPGQTLLLMGGMVPHALLPVRSGQLRFISVLCFRVSD